MRFTKRDLALLLDLYSNIQLSFRQIHARHFKLRNKATVQNRLTKLLNHEVIQKRKFTGLMPESGKTGSETIYQLKKKGLKALTQAFLDTEFRKDIPTVTLSSLNHDLLLTEVLDEFKKLYPKKWIMNARLVSHPEHANEPKPDAIMTKLDGDLQTAIELELTAKSDRRYRELVLKYRLSRVFGEVIYIVARPRVAEKILTQIRGRRASQISLPHREGKFHFMELKNLHDTKHEKGQTT